MRVTVARSLTLQADFGRVVHASDAQQRGEQRAHVAASLTF